MLTVVLVASAIDTKLIMARMTRRENIFAVVCGWLLVDVESKLRQS